jgi:hypothetical protein
MITLLELGIVLIMIIEKDNYNYDILRKIILWPTTALE